MRKSMEPCDFCKILNKSNEDEADRPVWDKHLLESSNFVVTATKGSIVPRWLLISPKNHICSISQLPSQEQSELNSLLSELQILLEPAWGTLGIFEHGASQEGSLLGCGVNHAHLHMVSMSKGMAESILEHAEFEPLSDSMAMPYQSTNNQSYWYFYHPAFGSYINYPKIEISQFFRKIISRQIGKDSQYDYKLYPFSENAHATLVDFNLALLTGSQHVS